MNRKLLRQSLWAALPLVLLFTVQPAAAAAGVWSVKDTQAKPSVRCIYYYPAASVTAVRRIKVWPPKVYGQTNAPKVRWRFIVSYNTGGPPIYTSPWQQDTATPSTAANSFSPMQYTTPNGSYYKDEYGEWTVDLLIQWRNSSNNVVGTAAHAYEWYRETFVGSSTGPVKNSPCLNGI